VRLGAAVHIEVEAAKNKAMKSIYDVEPLPVKEDGF